MSFLPGRHCCTVVVAASYTEAEAFLQPQSTQHPQNAPWLLLMGFLTTAVLWSMLLLLHTRQNTKLEAPAYFIACIYTHFEAFSISSQQKSVCVSKPPRLNIRKQVHKTLTACVPCEEEAGSQKNKKVFEMHYGMCCSFTHLLVPSQNILVGAFQKGPILFKKVEYEQKFKQGKGLFALHLTLVKSYWKKRKITSD